MPRIKADLLMIVAAFIWGLAFLFQKTAMDSVGPYTFVAARFLLSGLVVLPFALREAQKSDVSITPTNQGWLGLLCGAFTLSVICQQVGIVTTTVANASFLTGLYAVIVPIIAWLLFQQKPSAIVWSAALLCVFGVWLLGDASFISFQSGDIWVLACACFFALHTALVGHIGQKFGRPLTMACLQYFVCGGVAFGIAICTESLSVRGLHEALPGILYAGILSGGIAYTLQCITQQYAPASDAGVILSSESLFGALAGCIILGERLSLLAWTGCAVILLAVIAVSLAPSLQKMVRSSL